MAKLLPAQVLSALPAKNAAIITGQAFFPGLISKPFIDGLRIAFTFSLVLYIAAAIASWLRGGKYVHTDDADSVGDEIQAIEGVLPE